MIIPELTVITDPILFTGGKSGEGNVYPGLKLMNVPTQ
jgi:hypothetical protein